MTPSTPGHPTELTRRELKIGVKPGAGIPLRSVDRKLTPLQIKERWLHISSNCPAMRPKHNTKLEQDRWTQICCLW